MMHGANLIYKYIINFIFSDCLYNMNDARVKLIYVCLIRAFCMYFLYNMNDAGAYLIYEKIINLFLGTDLTK